MHFPMNNILQCTYVQVTAVLPFSIMAVFYSSLTSLASNGLLYSTIMHRVYVPEFKLQTVTETALLFII